VAGYITEIVYLPTDAVTHESKLSKFVDLTQHITATPCRQSCLQCIVCVWCYADAVFFAVVSVIYLMQCLQCIVMLVKLSFCKVCSVWMCTVRSSITLQILACS